MKKNNLFIFFITRIVFAPLILVGFLLPKNRKVWVFGCSSGNYYKDNSKYLFEFVSRIPGYEAVWLTKSRDVLEKVRDDNSKCYYFYSPKGIFYSLIAKFVFISYSYDDVGFFCYLFPQKTKIVQLYHGTPLKRLDVEKNRSRMNRLVRFVLLSYVGRKFDFMFSASDLATEKFNDFFREDEKKYIVSGYPRNDALFKKNQNEFLKQIERKIAYDKIIFYLPTYREYPNNKDFNLFDKFGFQEEELNKILERHRAIFLIKLHPNDYVRANYILKKFSDDSRIIIVADTDIESDIYPLLAHTDILVTDYSSIYIDFLLLNRPVIFSAFDKVEYEGMDRGFYFDYDDTTPGPKVGNWEDLGNEIDVALSGRENFEVERVAVNNLLNKFHDGSNCARIYNELKFYE